MAGKTITMSKIKQILLHRRNGAGMRTIGEAVGLSKNTVKKYLRLMEVRALTDEQALSMNDEELEALLDDPAEPSALRQESLEALFPLFEMELKRTGVTRWVLWGEYRSQYPDGYSYSQFCDYFRQWQTAQSATMHLDHTPGDKLFIDFTGKKMYIVDPDTGEQLPQEVYIAIMGYSQLTYVEVVSSQQLADFIRATENALHYFGGIPKVLVPDNLKSAVHKAGNYEAQLNEAFRGLANHYQSSVLPARSKKPRDKALVENAVNIAYSRIFAPLRNQVFYNLRSLNEAVTPLLEAHNAYRFQKMPLCRKDIFEQQERHLLGPLAPERYELKSFKEVTVMKNCHIHLHEDHHYYSVPYRYIGRKVKVVYTSTQVSVFCDKERIAYYIRDRKAFGYTTTKEHLPSSHQFVSEWSPEKFTHWAEGIHPSVKEYITHILESKAYPEQTYRSCVGILSQERKVGRDRLVRAVERAISFGSYNYTTIANILTMGLDRLEEPDKSIQTSLPLHDNIRGAGHYQ
jgi:transposase